MKKILSISLFVCIGFWAVAQVPGQRGSRLILKTDLLGTFLHQGLQLEVEGVVSRTMSLSFSYSSQNEVENGNYGFMKSAFPNDGYNLYDTRTGAISSRYINHEIHAKVFMFSMKIYRDNVLNAPNARYMSFKLGWGRAHVTGVRQELLYPYIVIREYNYDYSPIPAVFARLGYGYQWVVANYFVIGIEAEVGVRLMKSSYINDREVTNKVMLHYGGNLFNMDYGIGTSMSITAGLQLSVGVIIPHRKQR